MADPVVTEVSYRRVAASAPASSFVWDISFVAVTSAGTRYPERKGFGSPGAGLTAAQVKAAVLQIAADYDTAEKNPPVPPTNLFAGTFDALTGAQITDPTDPRLPPGVTP